MHKKPICPVPFTSPLRCRNVLCSEVLVSEHLPPTPTEHWPD